DRCRRAVAIGPGDCLIGDGGAQFRRPALRAEIARLALWRPRVDDARPNRVGDDREIQITVLDRRACVANDVSAHRSACESTQDSQTSKKLDNHAHDLSPRVVTRTAAFPEFRSDLPLHAQQTSALALPAALLVGLALVMEFLAARHRDLELRAPARI